MDNEPNFFSSLAEHWELARKLRGLRINFDPEKCTGVWQCYDVCPIGLWQPDHNLRKAHFVGIDNCIACGACVLQCPQGAIELK
jgi:NAD-dependent dihydropyrimidine dehydrogenase PreA subunit